MELSYELALKVVAGAHERARALGITITAVVVDGGGHVVAAGRMDGAPSITPQVAESKAVGAAVFHRTGEQFANMYRDRPGFFGAANALVRMPLVPGLGSALIHNAEGVLGAVGVSGGKPEEDLECAEAGVSAGGS